MPALSRLTVVLFATASFVLAAVWLTGISQIDPWYRNTDMNIRNMVDALSLNSDLPPNQHDQPGVPTKFLLALDYRALHFAGQLPVWSMRKFAASPDPLRQIPALIRAERLLSRLTLLAFILAVGRLAYLATRNPPAAGLSIILLCGSPGILFHGMLSRTELLCVFFGNILALLCTLQATGTSRAGKKHLWLFLAGIFGGLSALEKLPGAVYLAMCYGWCWLAATTPTARSGDTEPKAEESDGWWWGLLPVAASLFALWMLYILTPVQGKLGVVALVRLRLAATAIGVLPLLSLWPRSGRLWSFGAERGREFSVLAAGALAALPLSYLLLRAVLSKPTATTYLATVLNFLINPASDLPRLADNPHVGQVLLQHLLPSAWLLLGTVLGVLCCWLVRGVPRQRQAFLTVLLAVAFGMLVLLSKRHFTIHYSIFYLAPLLLTLGLSLSTLAGWLQDRHPGSVTLRWSPPALAALAFGLVLTAGPRARQYYANYQDDAQMPVSELTLTLIFDHDALTPAYLNTMAERYQDRAHFRAAIDRYLSDEANRY